MPPIDLPSQQAWMRDFKSLEAALKLVVCSICGIGNYGVFQFGLFHVHGRQRAVNSSTVLRARASTVSAAP